MVSTEIENVFSMNSQKGVWGGTWMGFLFCPVAILTAVDAVVLSKTDFSVGRFGMQITLTYGKSIFLNQKE